MRLAEQHEDHSVRMALPDLGDLVRGMAIAGADLAQILARHAIQPVERFAVIPRSDEQFVERRPIVSPIEIEADALPQFGFINFAPPPFVENVLIAGKDGLDSEDNWPIASQRALLDQRGGVDVARRAERGSPRPAPGRPSARVAELRRGQNRLVSAEALLNSRRYFRRPCESCARISRSTPASACSCAALRRDRRLAVDAIFSF